MNEFDSIERLVQFGLGVSIAQQMSQSMATAMQQMSIPGQQIPAKSGDDSSWSFVIEGKAYGPCFKEEIIQLFIDHKINKETLAWTVGMPTWRMIEQIPQLNKILLTQSSL